MKMDKGLETAYHAPSTEGWAPGNLDFFVVPAKEFTEEEHGTWSLLYNRQMDILQDRAVKQFISSLKELGINEKRIPSIDDVNKILMERTGFQAVPVAGFMPENAFFEL